MTKYVVLLLAIIAWVGAQGSIRTAQAVEVPLLMQVSEHLWTVFQTAGTPLSITVAGDKLASATLLSRFYTQRLFWPAWSGNDGSMAPGEALLQALRDAEHEGLNPKEYHFVRLEKLLAEIRQRQSQYLPPVPMSLATLDLLLSDAFLTYARHLADGRSNPDRPLVGAHGGEFGSSLETRLQRALETQNIAEALNALLPPQPEYAKLRQALMHYRRAVATGGWPPLPAGLHKGDRNPHVSGLQARLRATGDLPWPRGDDENLFDSTVEQAVLALQKRQGFGVTGVVSGATLSFFNVPAQTRARQVAHNMERWRWLPHDLGNRHVLVNIPAFTLDVIEQGQSILSMRVVVGKPSWPTPVLSAVMTQVILSPTWTIPQSIMREEILPILRQNPGYLAQRNMKIIKTDSGSVPFVVRQEPGPKNPLGGVKFLFPNRHQVYLHDTPSRSLFAKPVRAFSHGCIRLERPLDLAEHILRGVRPWSRERIQAAAGKTVSRFVSLPSPLPVHLTYRTVDVREDGTLFFRPDIYSHDDDDKTLAARPSIALP